MTVIQRVVKPRTQRAKRALKAREPKIIENVKKTLFLHGKKSGCVGRELVKNLYSLKKPNAVHLPRKNDFLPFEDHNKIEWLSKKYDASLFAMSLHSKKRPENMIFGRLFNHHLLDMIELGVEDFRSLADFHNAKVSSETKPCIAFCGVDFTQSPEYISLKSLLLDFFRGAEVSNVLLQGFELAIQFTACEGKVYMRTYRIQLKKSGTPLPRIELEEIGPSLTFTLRRMKLASDDLMKTACKRPKQLHPKPVKNISKDNLGSKLGRIHMTKQDMGKLQTRKLKALKRPKSAPTDADSLQRKGNNEVDSELAMEVQ